MSTLNFTDLSVSAEPITRRLVEELRHDIVTMHIKPGEKLSEQVLAQRFGVSRQPVREAFIKLAEAGLLRILPQRGTMVVNISLKAVEDAHFVREAIECSVVREAARAGDSSALQALRQCLEETERAIVVKDTEHWFFLDDKFHQLLAVAAGHPNAWNVVVEQKAQMDRVRYLDISDPVPMQVVLAQHQEILQAVEAASPKDAELAMRRHLAEIFVSLPKLAARWPELFV